MNKQDNDNFILNSCVKHQANSFKEGELRAIGSFLMKIFNIQNLNFASYTCNSCGYTELYKKSSSKGGNILDFFFNLKSKRLIFVFYLV